MNSSNEQSESAAIKTIIGLPYSLLPFYEKHSSFMAEDGSIQFVQPERTFEMMDHAIPTAECEMRKRLCNPEKTPIAESIDRCIEANFYVLRKRWEEVKVAIARYREIALREAEDSRQCPR